MEENTPIPASQKVRFQKNKIILLFLSAILFLSLSLNIYLITKHLDSSKSLPTEKKNSQIKNPFPITKINGWKKLESNAQGYPIVKNNIANDTRSLFIYSLAKNKLEDLGIQPDYYGGSLGSGSNDPLSSPNLDYTAYIDSKTKNLWLISNETLEKRQITKYGNVSVISGWSPDNKKIVYYINGPNSESESQETSKNRQNIPNLLPGFHAFNIDSGEDTHLKPASYFEGFINNDNIMVRENYNNELPYIFNINDFSIDKNTIKDRFEFGLGQFNFSLNGKKWTFRSGTNNLADPVNIIYADFPNKNGVLVDTGFATSSATSTSSEWPIISPNQDRIAYRKREGEKSSGIPKFTVWVYEINSKSKSKYANGSPKVWVENDRLIMLDSKNDYYLLDLKSGQQTKIN